MTAGPVPMCIVCTHLIDGSFRCAAFPQGIPSSIIENHADHRQPIDGDNGIRFDSDGSEHVQVVLDGYGSA